MQTNKQTNGGTSDNMKHPESEDWMCFLYGETPRAGSEKLVAHLRECTECRTRVEGWRGAMGRLEHWQVAPSIPGSRRLAKAAKWAAAAAVMISLGFGLGRVIKPTPVNATEIRASIQSDIRKELLTETGNQRTEWEQYKALLQQQREEDNRLMIIAMRKLESDREQELLALRKDLETVAVLTQAGFRQANQQIASLEGHPMPEQKTQDH